MKKHLSKITIAFIALILIGGLIMFLLTTKRSNNYKPDYDYAVLVYHSEFIGPDAATSYNYLIYPSSVSDNSSYFTSKLNHK